MDNRRKDLTGENVLVDDHFGRVLEVFLDEKENYTSFTFRRQTGKERSKRTQWIISTRLASIHRCLRCRELCL